MRIQKVLSEVDQFCNFFFDERIQITLKAGYHWPTRETAFCWCANDGLTLNAGLVALSLSGVPYQYC